MRLDKYLKVSRLIKRRTVAKDATTNEHVYVNNEIKKPSYNVKVGDIILIKFAVKSIKVKVTSLTLEKDTLMYEIIEEEKVTT